MKPILFPKIIPRIFFPGIPSQNRKIVSQNYYPKIVILQIYSPKELPKAILRPKIFFFPKLSEKLLLKAVVLKTNYSTKLFRKFSIN